MDSEPMLPSLHRLAGERGTELGGAGCAHDVRASGPSFVSLPGYLEAFTGKVAVYAQRTVVPSIPRR